MDAYEVIPSGGHKVESGQPLENSHTFEDGRAGPSPFPHIQGRPQRRDSQKYFNNRIKEPPLRRRPNDDGRPFFHGTKKKKTKKTNKKDQQKGTKKKEEDKRNGKWKKEKKWKGKETEEKKKKKRRRGRGKQIQFIPPAPGNIRICSAILKNAKASPHIRIFTKSS